MKSNKNYGFAAALIVLSMAATGCTKSGGGQGGTNQVRAEDTGTAGTGQSTGQGQGQSQQQAQKQAQQQQQKQAQQQQQAQKQAQQQSAKQAQKDTSSQQQGTAKQQQSTSQQQGQQQGTAKQQQGTSQQTAKQQQKGSSQQGTQQGTQTFVGSFEPMAAAVRVTANENALNVRVASADLQADHQYMALVRSGASCANEDAQAQQVIVPLKVISQNNLEQTATVNNLDQILSQGDAHVTLVVDSAPVACAELSK